MSKRLLVLSTVLGLLIVAGAGAVAYSARQRQVAIGQLRAAVARHDAAVAAEQSDVSQLSKSLTRMGYAHVKLDSVMNTVVNGSQACLTVTCFGTTASAAGNANKAFLRTLRGISFPAGVSSTVKKFEKDATANGLAWMNMSRAVSFTDYGDRATRAEKFGRAFDGDYSALVTSLNLMGDRLTARAEALDAEAAALRQRGEGLKVTVSPLTLPPPSTGTSLT